LKLLLVRVKQFTVVDYLLKCVIEGTKKGMMYLREFGCGDMDWIDLDEDRDRWRTLVNVVLNLVVPYSVGNFLTS